MHPQATIGNRKGFRLDPFGSILRPVLANFLEAVAAVLRWDPSGATCPGSGAYTRPLFDSM